MTCAASIERPRTEVPDSRNFGVTPMKAASAFALLKRRTSPRNASTFGVVTWPKPRDACDQRCIVAQLRMPIDVVIDLALQVGRAALQPVHVFMDRSRQHRVAGVRFEPIEPLLLHVLERLQTIYQAAQFPYMHRRRLPRLGLHLRTKARKQCGIGAVGLVTQHLALREAFDARWVDHRNHPAGVAQRCGTCLAIGAARGIAKRVRRLRAACVGAALRAGPTKFASLILCS